MKKTFLQEKIIDKKITYIVYRKMHLKLQKPFEKLEQARHRMLARIENYTNQQLCFKPAPDEWSMAQVVKHLVMTESQILTFTQKKIAKGELQPSDLKSWLRYITVKLALRFRKKIKAPKQVAGPPEVHSFAQVKEEWAQLRKQWQEMLEKMPHDVADKNVFKHPLAGYMNMPQTLGFMKDHLTHHMDQLERIRQSQNWQ